MAMPAYAFRRPGRHDLPDRRRWRGGEQGGVLRPEAGVAPKGPGQRHPSTRPRRSRGPCRGSSRGATSTPSREPGEPEHGGRGRAPRSGTRGRRRGSARALPGLRGRDLAKPLLGAYTGTERGGPLAPVGSALGGSAPGCSDGRRGLDRLRRRRRHHLPVRGRRPRGGLEEPSTCASQGPPANDDFAAPMTLGLSTSAPPTARRPKSPASPTTRAKPAAPRFGTRGRPRQAEKRSSRRACPRRDPPPFSPSTPARRRDLTGVVSADAGGGPQRLERHHHPTRPSRRDHLLIAVDGKGGAEEGLLASR